MHRQRLSVEAHNLTKTPYRVRDIAIDVGLLMTAFTFILLGGTGLVGRLAGINYPLSGLMVTDAALTGLLAGCCLLGWLTYIRQLSIAAALPLAAITLYTLLHNSWVGGPWASSSWVSGGPRILSLAALLLSLVALCTLLNMEKQWHRTVWAVSGALALMTGFFSLFLLLSPAHRLSWSEEFVSGPVLATLYALLGGAAFVGAAWRGHRRLLPLGNLTTVAAAVGVIASCLAWYTLSWNAQHNLQRQVATLMDNVALNARHTTKTQLEWIQRLAWRYEESNSSEPSDDWLLDVNAYFQHAPYLKSIALFNPRGELIDLQTSPHLQKLTLWQNESLEYIHSIPALEWTDPWVLQPEEHQSTMLLIAPTGNDLRYYVVAEIDLIELLTSELSVLFTNFRLVISGEKPFLALVNSGPVLEITSPRPLPHVGSRLVGLPGGARLSFDVYLENQSVLLNSGIIPASFAVAGLTLSYLLALSLGLIKLVRDRSAELLLTKQQIQSQYDLEQRFRSLYLYNPDGVFSLDKQGYIISANEACSTITGRTNSEILGSHFSDLLRPKDINTLQEIFVTTLSGEPKHAVFQLQHSEGDLKVIDLTAMPMVIEEEIEGVFGIILNP